MAVKIGMPSLIDKLPTGILIQPNAQGVLPIPGFPNGLSQVYDGFAVSPVLYEFATVASIILLFSSGLEIDIDLFLSCRPLKTR